MEKEVSLATLPALANGILTWFKGDGYQVFSIAEIEAGDKFKSAKRPYVTLAIAKETNSSPPRETISTSNMVFIEDVVVEFWLEPQRMVLGKSGEATPYWAYYDLDALKRKLITHAVDWCSPSGGGLHFVSMETEVNESAHIASFRFAHIYKFKKIETETGVPVGSITTQICNPTCV